MTQKPAEKTTSTKPATTSAAAAVREELRALLTAEPFGLQQLTNIESIARAGKMLLQATQGHTPNGLSQNIGGGMGYYSAVGQMDGGIATPFIPNQNETFGAKALREVVAALKRAGDQSRTRMTVLRELALARKEGLEDLAVELKAELDDLKNVDARMAGGKPGLVQELEGIAS